MPPAFWLGKTGKVPLLVSGTPCLSCKRLWAQDLSCESEVGAGRAVSTLSNPIPHYPLGQFSHTCEACSSHLFSGIRGYEWRRGDILETTAL